MTLTALQRQWLREEAQETLGLTAVRARILASVLDRAEPFSLRGVGRQTGQSAENVRLALELMVARELLEIQVLAHPHRPRASHLAQPGRRLELILASLEPRRPDPSPGVLQNS